MADLPLDPFAGPESKEGARLADYWRERVDDCYEEYRKWHKRGETIERRYRDERNRVDEEGQKRYNLLWANVQVLQPALYARAPTATAERRFRDRDPIGRTAAQILERGLRNEVEVGGLHDAMQRCVLDYLLAGAGVPWLRYEPEFGEGLSIPVDSEMSPLDDGDERSSDEDEEEEPESPEDEHLESTGEQVVRESVQVDYIHWSDFVMMPAKARTWKEVSAVGKRCYMTRDEMVERFGKRIGRAVPLQRNDKRRRHNRESVVTDDEDDLRGIVYEIWSKRRRQVYWIAEGYDYLLDRRDDPLRLSGFFPVPQPLLANPVNSTMIPTPDFIEYQDQAIQIDELTHRIALLTKACKIAGVYNSRCDDIKRLLDESVENELIPVDQWAVFAKDGGGVPGNVSFLPLKDIIGVLGELITVREKILQDADRLTGISDVMRGTMDGRETLGGQRLKTNAGGTRLQHRQSEVARLARDILRMMAEIMSEHFSVKSLLEASGILQEEGFTPEDVQRSIAPPPMPQLSPRPPMGLLPPPGPPGGPFSPQQPGLPGGVPTSSPPALPSPGIAGPAAPGGLPRPSIPTPPGAAPPMPSMSPPPGLPGLPAPPVPQVPPALVKIARALSLLRDERLRGFRVDVEPDSIVFGDRQQDKADRVEFVSSVTKFMETAMTVGMQMPDAAPLLAKLLQFGVRGFAVGRELESAIEDFADKAEETAKARAAAAAAQPPPPNPAALKAQADAQKVQGDMAVERLRQQGAAAKAQAEVTSHQVQAQAETANSSADLQAKQIDLEMRRMEMEIEKMRLQVKLAEMQAQAAAMGAGGPAMPLSPQSSGALQ